MSKKPVAVADEEEEETTHKKYPHEEHASSHSAPEKPSGAKPEDRDTVTPLAAAAPTMSTFKSTNDEVGVMTAGATTNPGLAVAGSAKPSLAAPNGGVPVLGAVLAFGGDGLSRYLPMPIGAVLLEAQVFVVTAATGATTIKLANDATPGAADLGTGSVSAVGATNIPLLGAVVAGLTGNSLQVSVGSDATLQGVLAVQYMVMR